MSRISIIGGTGALGRGLTARLAAAGHEVLVGSRDPTKAATFASTFAANPRLRVSGAGLAEAAAGADICFICVPYAAHADTLAEVRMAVQGQIVVDATVPLRPPKVGTVQLPAAGCAALEAAAALGPDVKVVSALQNIGAEKLAGDDEIDSEVLVAGDDPASVDRVCAVLGEIGLKSWNVGPLANSAAAEALTSVIIQINRRYGLAQAGIRITGSPRQG